MLINRSPTELIPYNYQEGGLDTYGEYFLKYIFMGENSEMNFQNYIIELPIAVIFLLCVLFYVFKYTIPTYATKIVDSHFNEKIEKYKHELNLLTEAAKFNYQRLISDYNLYTTKRHEIYPELYSLLIIAENQIIFCDDVSRLSLEDCNEEDINNITSQLKTTKENQTLILKLWADEDKEGVREKIASIQKHTAQMHAKKSFINLKKKFLESRLYLSDDVESLCDEMVNILDCVYSLKDKTYADLYFMLGKINANYISPEDLEKMRTDTMGKIKEQMKKELSKAIE